MVPEARSPVRSMLDVRGNGPIAIDELRLARIEEFQILSEREEMLAAVVPGQRRDDLGL